MIIFRRHDTQQDSTFKYSSLSQNKAIKVVSEEEEEEVPVSCREEEEKKEEWNTFGAHR